MNRWWRALLTLVGAALALACAAWLVRSQLHDAAERWLAVALGRAAGVPVAVEGFELTFVPPGVVLAGAVAGEADGPALEVRAFAARLDLRAWAIEASAARLAVHPARLPSATVAGGVVELPAGAVLPRLDVRLDELEVEGGGWRSRAAGVRADLRPLLAGARAALEAREVHFERGEERLALAPVSATAEMRREGVVLRSAEILGEGISLRAVEEGDEGVRLSASVELARLGRLAGVSEPLAGTARFTGRLDFASGVRSVGEVHAAGSIVVEEAGFGAVELSRGEAAVEVRDRRLEARDLRLHLGQAPLGGLARVALEPPYAAEVTLDLAMPEGARLSPVLAESFESGPLAASAALQGTLAPLALEGRVEAKLAGLGRRLEGEPARPPAPVDARAELVVDLADGGGRARGTLELRSAAAAGAPVAAALDLAIEMRADRSLAGEAALEVGDARRLRALSPELGGGRVRAKLTLGGELQAPRLAGEVSAEAVVLSGYRFDSAGGAFEIDGEALVARAIEVRAVGGLARLDGRVAFTPDGENDWRATLTRVDLSAAWVALSSIGVELPYLTGTLEGEAVASGSWAAGDFEARLGTGALEIGTERLTRTEVHAVSHARRWTLDGELVRRPAETLRLAGAGDGLGPMWISAWSTPWRVAGFRFLRDLPPRRGDAVLTASLYGRLDDPLGRVELTLVDLGLGDRRLGTVSAELHALADGTVQAFLFDSEELLEVEAVLTPAGERPFRLRSTLRGFDLAHVLAPAQPLAMAAHGQAEVSGRAAMPLRSLTGELRLEQLAVGRDSLRLTAAEPVVVSVREGVFDIRSFDLRGDFGRVDVRGKFDLHGEVAVDVHVDADAGVVEAVPGSPVTWATGHVGLDARVRRPAGGEFDLDGRGNLVGVSVDLGLPFLLTDANADFVLHGSRIDLERLTGRGGGGDFALAGHVDLVEGLALRWQANEISSGFLEWLEDQVSGTGEIRGPFDEITVAGDVRVLSAVYDRDLELTDILPVFRRDLGTAPPKPGERPILLDLHIRAPDSIYVDNNLAAAEFSADLQIGGTDLDPELRGRVDLLEGQATIFDRRFEVTLGRIRFDGGPVINPRLEFVATTDVSTPEGEYAIVAKVGGTLDDPRIELGADDASLTTNDVVTLLTVGKTMAQLQSEGGGVSASDLASLAPLLYGSQVERGVRRYLPVDRFSLEPGFSRVTGDFEPRVTVGSEISRGLRGTLSTTLAAQTQNRVQLEYQLTPRTLVVGSWESRTENNEGGFGGALKFRFRFRYLPFSLLPACCHTVE